MCNVISILVLGVLLTVAFCYEVECLQDINITSFPIPNINDEDERTIFFIFSNLMLSTIINYLLTHFGIPIPLGAVLFTLGMILGFGGLHSEELLKYLTVAELSPHKMVVFLFPAMTFKLSFCIDYHVFYKSVGQIFIISVPIFICSVLLQGFLMALIINPAWPASTAILFGNNCFTIYPISLIRLLKNIGGHTRPLCNLLEGEAMISLGIHAAIQIPFVLNYYEEGTAEHTGEIINKIITTFIVKPMLGAVFGVIGCFLIRHCHNDTLNLILVCLSYPMLSYYIMYQLPGAGSLSCFVIGFVMGLERKSLPNKMNELVTKSWEVAILVLNDLIYTVTGIWFAFFIVKWMEATDFIWIFITYVMANVSRFISFCVFLPILNKTGYGMNIQNMLILVWGGLRNPILLISIMSLKEVAKMTWNDVRVFEMHISILFLLDMLINGTTTPFVLKILGITNISMRKQINMNNCMKFILEKRERTMAVLKMDRLLSDANWAVVNASTEITHPYMLNLDNDSEDVITLENRTITCPACKTDIPDEPTPREFKEMMREARLRCLKTKKIAYIRQYESGLLSKDGLKTLIQFIETAMDSKELSLDVINFEKVFNIHYNVSPKRYKNILEDDDLQPPAKPCRRACYRLMVNQYFDFFIYAMVGLNLVFGITEIILQYYIPNNLLDRMIFNLVNSIFFGLYLVEFWVKIMGYSTVYIFKDGFVNYFKSVWNTIDFVVLLLCAVDLIIMFINATKPELDVSSSYLYTFLILKFLRCLRYIRLIRQFKAWFPKFVEIFDRRSEKQMAFAFEIGFALVKGEFEVLEMLPYMIDNKKIREEIQQTIFEHRLFIINLLSRTKKRKSWISVTVKTRKAIITTLNSIKDCINELRLSGWIDEVESKKLMISLEERYKYVSNLHYIPTERPRVRFREIGWMGKNDNIFEYLYSNVITRNYEPGDVVCKEGDNLDGIYYIMTGFLMQNYKPNEKSLKNLKESGILPIIDYPSPQFFDESFSDFIIRGNCVGELSVLTERPYDCEMVAHEYSQLYIIKKEVIREAMKMDADPLYGLQCRIWKLVSIRIAIPVMMSVTAYQTSDASHLIKSALVRSFVPDLSNFKMFIVSNKIEDIILIEGLAVDHSTRDVYTAPCYIPRSVVKIMLPHGESFISTPVETKLLIIPIKEADEYDIMLEEESICELIDTSSAKCLKHKIHEQELKKRQTRQVRGFGRTDWHKKKAGWNFRSGFTFVRDTNVNSMPAKQRRLSPSSHFKF